MNTSELLPEYTPEYTAEDRQAARLAGIKTYALYAPVRWVEVAPLREDGFIRLQDEHRGPIFTAKYGKDYKLQQWRDILEGGGEWVDAGRVRADAWPSQINPAK